jgi:hypothetical protein
MQPFFVEFEYVEKFKFLELQIFDFKLVFSS